ncbi:hypothetical protein Pfo_007758 [Paulownia fortunei]|nr:hypothetical protein Pfo_007758 [Paulownia fortunei]
MKYYSLFLPTISTPSEESFGHVATLLIHFVLFSQGGATNEMTVDSAAGKSTELVKGKCNKEKVECKEGNEGSQETILESEDYIYTQSLP